jgi:hypothetical protein
MLRNECERLTTSVAKCGSNKTNSSSPPCRPAAGGAEIIRDCATAVGESKERFGIFTAGNHAPGGKVAGKGVKPMRESILTDRLILRDITEADAELLFNLDSDPEVMRYIGPRPAADVAGYRDRTRTVYVPWQAHLWHGTRIVLDRTSLDFLGWVFIRPSTASKNARELGWTQPDEVEIGYRYRRTVWGVASRPKQPSRLSKPHLRTQQQGPLSRVRWQPTWARFVC